MLKNKLLWLFGVCCVWQLLNPVSLGFVFTPTEDQQIVGTEVVFSPKLLQENNISWVQALSPLEQTLFSPIDGLIEGAFFTYPITKKSHTSSEQLGFIPIASSIPLAQLATISPMLISTTEWWYAPSTQQWKSGSSQEITVYTLSPLISWWWKNYMIQKNNPDSYWIYSSAPLFFTWQYIFILLFCLLFIGQYFFSPSSDSSSLKDEKEFIISGVRISSAHIPKTWKTNFFSIYIFLKTHVLSKIFGILFIMLLMLHISFSEKLYAPVFVYPEENANASHVFSVVQSVVGESSSPLLFQFSSSGPSLLIGLTSTKKDRTEFFEKIPLLWNNTTYFQNNPWFSSSFSFPIWMEKKVPTAEDAKNEIKYLAQENAFQNNSFFWQPYYRLFHEVVPNFSAMREKKIPIAEWSAFYNIVGTGAQLGNVFVSLHNVWGLDFSQISLQSSDGKWVPASELMMVIPQKKEETPQSIFIRFDSIFDLNTFFISDFFFLLLWFFWWWVFFIFMGVSVALAWQCLRHLLAEK